MNKVFGVDVDVAARAFQAGRSNEQDKKRLFRRRMRPRQRFEAYVNITDRLEVDDSFEGIAEAAFFKQAKIHAVQEPAYYGYEFVREDGDFAVYRLHGSGVRA